MITIEQTASDLFDKIRNRFSNLEIGDEEGKSCSENPERARFFNFDFIVDGANYGNITVSITDTKSVKVFYDKSIDRALGPEEKKIWFSWLRDMREFARSHFKEWDVRDIAKSGLNLNDLKFLRRDTDSVRKNEVKTTEVAESKLYGTSRSSYQKLENVRIIARHSKPIVDENIPGARSRNIESFYIENSQGERFKLPEGTTINGARAYARHVKNGGELHDEFSRHIGRMIKEMADLRMFVRNMRGRTFEDIETQQMVESAVDHYGKLHSNVHMLRSQRGYDQYKSLWQPEVLEDIDIDIASLKERFVKKIFDDRINDALPVVFREYNKRKMAVEQEFESWANTIVKEFEENPIDKENKKQAEEQKDLEEDEIGVNVKGPFANSMRAERDSEGNMINGDNEEERLASLLNSKQFEFRFEDGVYYFESNNEIKRARAWIAKTFPKMRFPKMGVFDYGYGVYGSTTFDRELPNGKGVMEGINEDLRKWFKEKWVRFGPDGKIRGDCARGNDSEGKPKCLPQSKAHSLGKKGRASAASRKRRQDPNPERSGPAINVATKKKSNEDISENSKIQKIFKIIYYSPKLDRNVTKTIKAESESAVWDKLKQKGINVVSVKEQGVAEAINIDVFNPGFRHELKLGPYLYRASSKIKNQKYGLMITVYDGNKLIADAEFHIEPQPFDKRELRQDAKYSHLESYYTNVEPEYRRQGIMTNMYYYANALGNTIKPSDVRTDDSLAAWRSWGKDAKYLTKEGVAEGYILKKTKVEKTFEPGDPDEYYLSGGADVTTKDTDYEIINNKTGQVVGTAYWTTNDYFGPGALKITMKNGATRYLDIWASEKGNPQTAFNRFVKDPKTAKKYKEQGVAEDSRSHEERLDQRNAVEQVALHNRQMDYFQQFVDWSGKEMKDIYNNMDNHQLAYELENLGMQIAGNWRNQKYYQPGDPKREQFYSLMKQWYDLYKEAERKFSKDQGVAEGSEYTPPKLGTVKASIMNTTTPTVQIQVFKHNTLRGDSYWVTKQVKKFKTMDQAKAYVDRINNQGVAEGSDKTFTVIYYSKKTDRTVTKQIKASSESELWARLRAKDIDVISVEEQGVAEGSLNENQNSGIVYATGPRTTGTNDVDLIFKNLTTNKIVAWVVGNNDDGGVYEIRINQNGVKKGPPNFVATGNPQDDSDQHLIYKLGKPGTGRMSAIGSVMQNGFDKKNSTYYGQPLEFVGDDDWWSFLENMIGDITWEDDAIDAGYVDRLDNGDLVFVKQNLSRDSLNELAPNPGGGDGGGGDDGDDGFELPLDFKGQNVLVWPKNKKYSMGDTATPFPRGERFTGKVYIMWDGPKIEAIFYLDPKDREDREAEYERVYGPQGRGYEDWLDHKWYDTTTPRYRFVTDWKLKPAKEPGGWPGIVDAWGQDMKAEVMNHAQNFINDIIHNDGDGRHFVEPKQSVAEGYLNEFAPGDGNGEGRWYTDDQMIDMVGSDWAPEDDAGHLSLGQRLQDAQAWLDDQGYSVAVEDVQIDPDGGYRWKIYGEFYNPRFAKKDQGVAETSDYFRRREREEAIISGQKPARKKQPAQTSDYARRRAQEKKAEKGVAEGLSEMDNRTPSGDRREQRDNSPEEKAKREKKFQDNLKKAGPNIRKKLRLPEPKEGVAEGVESQYMAARYIDEFGDGDHWYVKGTPDVIKKFVQLANSLEDEAVKGTEYEPGRGQMAKIHALLGDDSTPQWTIVPAQNLENIRPIGNKVLQRLMSPDLANGGQEFMSELLWAMEAKGLASVHSNNETSLAEGQSCPECGGPSYSDRMLAEKQDACYHKVKSRYKVWPSAYASGALVQCRKKGAKNWGKKSESIETTTSKLLNSFKENLDKF